MTYKPKASNSAPSVSTTPNATISPASSSLSYILGRKIIESLGSALTELFPKRIHATTLKGFVLKVWGFVFAHNCKRLAGVL
jgi:hypothetical protein